MASKAIISLHDEKEIFALKSCRGLNNWYIIVNLSQKSCHVCTDIKTNVTVHFA